MMIMSIMIMFLENKKSLIKKNQRSTLVNDSVMRNYVERHMGHFFNNVSVARGITLWLSMAYVYHSGQSWLVNTCPQYFCWS